MTAGFYKYNNDLIFGKKIINKNYELTLDNKDSHVYPVDGFYFFGSKTEALNFFKLVENEDGSVATAIIISKTQFQSDFNFFISGIDEEEMTDAQLKEVFYSYLNGSLVLPDN